MKFQISMPKSPNKKISFLSCFVVGSLVFGSSFSPVSHAAVGEKAMVVTSDKRATQAALEVLKKGGNAVDALIAAQTVLNVVEPQSSGIGGAGYLLFYDAGTRAVIFLDGSVKSSSSTSPKIFLQPDGKLNPYKKLRQSGKVVGVPGTLKLLEELFLVHKSGKSSFAQLLEPAIELAENGTKISPSLAKALQAHMGSLATSSYFRDIFFKNGTLLKEGQEVVQQDLAKTFRRIQEKGTKAFYSGDISKQIERKIREKRKRGGLITRKDLKQYEIAKRNPLHLNYEGYSLFTVSPPAAGGVRLAAACRLLSGYSISNFFGKPEAIHFVNEAIKLSAGIPDAMGDPDIFELPTEWFLSNKWVLKQEEKIRGNKAHKTSLPQEKINKQKKDWVNTSILIVDKSGNMVAYTGALGSAFGSRFMIPGLGFFLNDLLLDFDMNPADFKDRDAPNIPGPGQRPKNFISPVFAFKKGQPVLVLNSQDEREASGIVLNMLVQYLDFKVPCDRVVEVPRILAKGDVLQMEKLLYDQGSGQVQLRLWGHKLQSVNSLGDGQMVCFDGDSGKLVGKSDPRSVGDAAGY